MKTHLKYTASALLNKEIRNTLFGSINTEY